MDAWTQEKEKSRTVFKETIGYDRPSRFTGWRNAKIAAYTPILERKYHNKPKRSESEYAETKSVGAASTSSRFRLTHGQICQFCKKSVTSTTLKEHVKLFHLNSRACKFCPFVVESGQQSLNLHINIKHKHIHECGSCKYANVSKLYNEHKNKRAHQMIQYHEIKTFNEMVEKFNLPISKLALPNLDKTEEPPREITVE